MRTASMHPVGIWRGWPPKATSTSRPSAPEVQSQVDHKGPLLRSYSKWFATTLPATAWWVSLLLSLHSSAGTATANYHRPGGLNSRNLSSHSIKGWELRKEGVGRAGSSAGLSLWLTDGCLLPRLHAVFPPSVHVYILISSFYKDTGHIGSEPMPRTSFYPNRLYKGPTSPYSHILRQEKFQLRNFAEIQFSP